MALVRSPVYTLTLTIQDRDKNTSTVSFYVSTFNTIVEIETAITDYYVPRVAALTNGTITGWSVSTTADEDGDTLAPEASDVQRKGVFSFKASNGASYVVSVPSIRNELVVDRTNVLDPNNQAVMDFVDMVLSSGPLALVRPQTYLGADIRSLQKAVKHHRASTRG